MSHPTMFSTTHLIKKRTMSQTEFWYIIASYGHVILPLCVPLRLCRLLVFKNLLLLIHTITHFSLLFSLLCFFLWFPNSFVFSSSFLLTLNIFISFLNPSHCIIMTQYVFQSLLRLVYHAKISRIMWMLIFVRVILKRQFTIAIFQIILYWRLIQIKNMIMQNFTVQILRVLKNL